MGPVIFVGLYVVATVLFVQPALTLGAGAVFGVALGSVWCIHQRNTGCHGAFLVGRYLARDAIARKIEKHEKFATLTGRWPMRGGRSSVDAPLAGLSVLPLLTMRLA